MSDTSGVRPSLADALMIAALMAVIGALYGHYWTTSAARQARVTVSGQPPMTVDLAVDQQFSVHGRIGHSTLEVADGRIRFVDSPCRHQVCVRSGWQSRAMDATACLPNRVSITLVGGDPEYDAVNF